MIKVTASAEYATAATKTILNNIDIIDVIRFNQQNELEITAYTNVSENKIKYAEKDFGWAKILETLVDKNWKYIDGINDIYFFNPKTH